MSKDNSKSSKSYEKILKAAARVFSKRPAATVTLSMIAQEAGISPSLLTRYFKDKNVLYRVVMDRVMELHDRFVLPFHQLKDQNHGLTESQAISILESMIEFVVEGLYNDHTTNAWRDNFLVFEILYNSKYYDEYYRAHFQRHYELMSDVVMAITNGHDRKEALLQSVMIFGQLLSFRIERQMLVRSTGMVGFDDQEKFMIRCLVLRNTAYLLDSQAMKRKYSAMPFFPEQEIKWSEDSAGTVIPVTGPDNSIESVQAIINAAKRLFSEYPATAVSLAQIAQEAHVTVSLVMYHFKNKANLYRVAFEQTLDHHRKRVKSFSDKTRAAVDVSKEQAVQHLSGLIGLLMEGMYHSSDTALSSERMFLNEILFPSVFYEEFYRNFFRGNYERFSRLVETIICSGNRRLAFMQSVSVFGMIIAFRLERNVLNRMAGIDVYDPSRFEMMKAVVEKNALRILEASLEFGGSNDLMTTAFQAGKEEVTIPNEGDAKERIIAAATKVFSRIPFEMATLHDIAKEADVRHPLIVYHFKSKRQLYLKIIRKAIERHLEQMKPYIDEVKDMASIPADVASGLLAEMIGIMLDGLYFRTKEGHCPIRILMLEVCYPSEFYQEAYEACFKCHYETMVRLARSINPNLDEETAVIQSTQIFGLLVSYHVEHEILNRFIGYEGKTDFEQEKMKRIVFYNALTILKNPPQVQSDFEI